MIDMNFYPICIACFALVFCVRHFFCVLLPLYSNSSSYATSLGISFVFRLSLYDLL